MDRRSGLAPPSDAGTESCLLVASQITMTPRNRALIGLFSVSLVAMGHVGCGNRAAVDNSLAFICHPGKAACLTWQVGQVCNAQGQWATFQCTGSLSCNVEAGGCVESGSACTEGDCAESCTPYMHECTEAGLQRVCRGDGLGWRKSECPADSVCDSGACIGNCTTGTSSCTSGGLVRTCRSDETGYSESECPLSMSCLAGNCVSKTTANCTPGSSICLNETTALECLRDGSAHAVKDCPRETTCIGGKCFGTVCAAGESRCVDSAVAPFSGVQTCNDDGTENLVTNCAAGAACVLNKVSGAPECYVAPCTLNEQVCGDPDSNSESTTLLSRCETLYDGKIGWVAYRCEAPSTCKVTSNSSSSTRTASCYLECTPGTQRCKDSNVEVCSEDAKWEVTKCNRTNGTEDVCVFVPGTKQAVCGDKACKTLSSSATNYATRGRCSSDLISRCGEDARLGDAVACEKGQCMAATDGFGSCEEPSVCQHPDGWRECVSTNDSYVECVAGHWDPKLCDAGELCKEAAEGLAACGDHCVPGMQHRCVDATNYQDCLDDGTWGPALPCGTGECNPKSNDCESACLPGDVRCIGEIVVASNGSSLGSRAMQFCSSNGNWTTPAYCNANTLCRRSGLGRTIGCVECVGGTVLGGNEEGAIDDRCSADLTGRQECEDDNTWPSYFDRCPGATEHCVKQRYGSMTGTCSDYGCKTSTERSKRCIGYETLSTSVKVDDCCAGECDSSNGKCLHRQRHFDSTCAAVSSCLTGYDTSGTAIYEKQCCTGFCSSGNGCLKIKANACAAIESCAVTKLDHLGICCGNCQTTGLCLKDGDSPHPMNEYFACGTSDNFCWGLGSCALKKSGDGTGAMFANCVE